MKIAIIGASKERGKFSNKAIRAYKEKDHVVFPVNPHEKEIEGLRCYNTVLDIPLDVEVASIYLPPEIGIKVIDDIIKKGIKKVYLNPGSSSQEIIKKLKENKIEVVLACSIREIKVNPSSL
jgi:uncharacterized protein